MGCGSNCHDDSLPKFNSNGVSESTDYTTFVYDVSNSQVKEARFDANEITVTKNDGSKYMTVMPPLEDKKTLR